MRSLVLLLLLSGCGLTTEGPFPSLQPRPGEIARTISAPGEGTTPSLSKDQRASLSADLAANEKALAAAQADIRTAEAELGPAVKAAASAPVGSEAWSVAQLKLSRFDQARSPLSEIASRMAPARIMVDSLPDSDPSRARVASLDRETEALLKRTAATADSANRALKRG